MGEHADYLIDQMIDGHWNSHRPRRSRGGFHKGVGAGMWKSNEGIIPMTDMTTAHIMNSVSMCEKTNNTGKKAELEAELQRRQQEGQP